MKKNFCCVGASLARDLAIERETFREQGSLLQQNQDSLAGGGGSGSSGDGGALAVGGNTAPLIGVVAPDTPLLPIGVPGPQRARYMSGSIKAKVVGMRLMPMEAAIRTRSG